jgi:inosine-uridine nucleoside N-ribohydrolase
MTRTKILIDCDPGHDDAVAILYAARHLDLVGVTTCHGNNTIGNVTRNALSVLTLGGIDVPLAQGCGDPMLGRKALVSNAHGRTGLDGTSLPAPDRAPVAAHAVDFMIDMARAHKGELVLAVIGPATNVAWAINKEPRFASWLREISLMGGSTGLGNITPVAEYNVWCDPEAAAEVFGCGAPIRMAGYNVTSVTGTNEADIARLLAGPKVARHIGELLDFYLHRQRERLGFDIAPMHDVCAIVPYVQEGLIDYRRCHVGVELNGRLTRGMTVCDLRTLTPEGRAERGVGEANTLVAIRSEARALIDHVLATLLEYP